MIREDEVKFWEHWQKSPESQIMLPDRQTPIIFDKDEGYLRSITFGAFSNNTLPRIEELLQKYKISEKGTDAFKGQLRENWLNAVRNRPANEVRNICNRTMAALAELAVADYLKNIGCKIIDLSAWNDEAPDITYASDNEMYAEVKYLSDSPELYEQRVDAAKGNQYVSWLPTLNQTLNYFFSRIAEAVLQLEKYEKPSRHLFLVFDHIATFLGRDDFDRYYTEIDDWCRDKDGEISGIPGNRAQVLSRKPKDWLRDCNKLTVCTLKDFSIIDARDC